MQGLYVGMNYTINPLYTKETIPTELLKNYSFLVQLGILLGFFLGLFVPCITRFLPDYELRICLVIGAILPLLHLILVYFQITESPYYLMNNLYYLPICQYILFFI